MRKLNLKSYLVPFRDTNTNEITNIPYALRDSIEAILLATGEATTQRLSMRELLENAGIAQKIKGAEEDFVLLEEDEFQKVKRAFDAFRGFSRADVEMCKRIEEAEVVEVSEKKVKKE